MKTTILIQDGLTQIVLAPETEFEKRALEAFKSGDTVTTIRRGTFDMTQGGYVREFDERPRMESLMLVKKDEPRP